MKLVCVALLWAIGCTVAACDAAGPCGIVIGESPKSVPQCSAASVHRFPLPIGASCKTRDDYARPSEEDVLAAEQFMADLGATHWLGPLCRHFRLDANGIPYEESKKLAAVMCFDINRRVAEIFCDGRECIVRQPDGETSERWYHELCTGGRPTS